MDISQIPFYFSEYIMHFDKYIPVVMASYGSLIYFILFMIIFCETGLVVTPFLPGDSLLFACGALSATANSLHFGTLFAICLAAAILGDTSNYWIGEKFGAIFLCRFVPIVRTFAPFVAGIGTMHYSTFLHYNVIGGLTWVGLFTGAGYFFGNIPFVKENFSHVALGIIIVSVLPIVYEFIKAKTGKE